MALLDDLVARLRAVPLVGDVRVIESLSVDAGTFQFKVRASVGEASLQIRFLKNETFVRYSFQLFTDRPVARWDNAPHYPGLPHFPHHFHNADNIVSASSLTGDVLADLGIVLADLPRLINT